MVKQQLTMMMDRTSASEKTTQEPITSSSTTDMGHWDIIIIITIIRKKLIKTKELTSFKSKWTIIYCRVK